MEGALPLSADTLEVLVRAGLKGDALVAAARAVESDIAAALPQRSKGAERQARFRERHALHSDVTSDVTPLRYESNATLPLDKENPQTPKEIKPLPKENPPKGGQKKGTRIGDYAPSIEAAVSMGLSRKAAEAEARKFVDYFRGAAREKGIKLDWPATWRNWTRRAMEQLGIAENTPGGSDLMVPKHDPRWQFLVARWERENSRKFPDLADKWPFPELWLKDANKVEEPDIPGFLDRRAVG